MGIIGLVLAAGIGLLLGAWWASERMKHAVRTLRPPGHEEVLAALEACMHRNAALIGRMYGAGLLTREQLYALARGGEVEEVLGAAPPSADT